MMNRFDTYKPHILIVDDEPEMRSLLRQCFEQEGYRVSEAENRREANERLGDGIDLITLDLNLRGEDGLAIAREIRSQSNVAIIMVTAKHQLIDRVIGLELGADDYITKPFHISEIRARVRSVLRRPQPRESTQTPEAPPASQRYMFGEWIVHFSKLEIRSVSGNQCKITTGQLKLLEVFAKNPDQVLSRDQILDMLKGYDWMPTDRSIDNQISRLRKIIEPDPKRPRFIKTVHGAGYKFTANVKVVD